MLLKEDRLAHVVNGRLYLAGPEDTPKPYIAECRKVYGDLLGVRFVKVAKGTNLTVTSAGGYVLPHASRCTPINALTGKLVSVN